MDPDNNGAMWVALIFLGLPTFLWLLYIFKNYKLKKKIKALLKEIAGLKSEFQERTEVMSNDFDAYKAKAAHLIKYEGIVDAEAEAKKILTEARVSAKSMTERAETKLSESERIASSIESAAREKAEEIAGDAWEAKQNSDQYEATAKAMKNIIKGYGDEYLMSNNTVLDGLAAEYDHKQAGVDLQNIRKQIKSMVRLGAAAECDYVDPHRKATAIDFVLDAFNGKIDSIMAKAKHDNYGKLIQQLQDSFRIVNHNGQPFRNARITERYYDVMVQQLKAAVTVHEIKRKDMEEQKRIREEIREEQRARKEFERAIKKAEKEEQLLQKAMKVAEAKLAGAAAEEKAKFQMQLDKLNEKLIVAEEKGRRALSMAQQTKQGHVYVISNIGSFGENVFKIGLTRRLEPLDRVKELGDASVPFSFDVHAMIHSTDAPKLEKDLHTVFAKNQVNKVNPRKEFFNLSLAEIREHVSKQDLDAHWTMKAEAQEYRESMQLSEPSKGRKVTEAIA